MKGEGAMGYLVGVDLGLQFRGDGQALANRDTVPLKKRTQRPFVAADSSQNQVIVVLDQSVTNLPISFSWTLCYLIRGFVASA